MAGTSKNLRGLAGAFPRVLRGCSEDVPTILQGLSEGLRGPPRRCSDRSRPARRGSSRWPSQSPCWHVGSPRWPSGMSSLARRSLLVARRTSWRVLRLAWSTSRSSQPPLRAPLAASSRPACNPSRSTRTNCQTFINVCVGDGAQRETSVSKAKTRPQQGAPFSFHSRKQKQGGSRGRAPWSGCRSLNQGVAPATEGDPLTPAKGVGDVQLVEPHSVSKCP